MMGLLYPRPALNGGINGRLLSINGGGRMWCAHCTEFIGIVGTLWPGGRGGGSTDWLIGGGFGQNGSGRYGSTVMATNPSQCNPKHAYTTTTTTTNFLFTQRAFQPMVHILSIQLVSSLVRGFVPGT